MKKIRIDAPAKVNIFLEVESKRADGYHNISSVFCLTDLKDTVVIEKTKKKTIEFSCNIKSLENENNLAYVAAEKMREIYGIKSGIKIRLIKKIPWGAGLGGGSSDCAAVILGIRRLFKVKMSKNKLMKLGSSLGADVPFFLSGFKTALIGGIGDKVTKLPRSAKFYTLIVKPPFGISTKWAYSKIKFPLTEKRKIDKIQLLKCSYDINAIALLTYNRFEQVALKKYPLLKRIKSTLLGSGALAALMTGSGSACFGIYESFSKAKAARRRIPGSYGITYLAKV